MKCYMKLFLITSVIHILSLYANALPAPANKEQLEERVKELLKKPNVDLRHDVNDLFLLADIYLADGNDKAAFNLYQNALSVNPWRLEYQLKLSELFKKHGEKTEAIERATTVYQYAEDENLIGNAKKILSDLGEYHKQKTIETRPLAKNIEIVIVPIGKTNQMLLHNLIDCLQEKMGIQYSISEKALDIGKIDRSLADSYLTKIIDRIKSELPQEQFQILLSELNLNKEALEETDNKIKFIDAFFKKSGLTQGKIEQFHNNINCFLNQGQYDAARLLGELRKALPATQKMNFKGYLGVMEEDIFTSDYNFLYGLGGPCHAVMSYHRFRASFTSEPQNRPRLLERTIKQCISSSCYILGIPKCSTPDCARAYPNDLHEHDQKHVELCPSCKKHLSTFIDEAKTYKRILKSKNPVTTIVIIVPIIILIVILTLFFKLPRQSRKSNLF